LTDNNSNVKYKIDKIETTDDCLSSRAGLALVTRYIKSTRICDILFNLFSFIRKSSKGAGLYFLFHQIICFFFDGSNFHLIHFNNLVKDEGYAATIETSEKHMASSHTIKRFFQAISNVYVWLFRKVLQQLFIWRLRIDQPELNKLGIDTMAMDNDDAINVPIVFMADTGFYDNELFKLCDRLQTGFVFGGKMYDEIKDIIIDKSYNEFSEYKKNGKTWLFCEFEDKRKSWDTAWHTIYTKPIIDDEGQILLEFTRPETIIDTNIGMNNLITRVILEVKRTEEKTINPQAIITLYHQRGRDELVNRGLKDFGV
jgi:hypothetical protein